MCHVHLSSKIAYIQTNKPGPTLKKICFFAGFDSFVAIQNKLPFEFPLCQQTLFSGGGASNLRRQALSSLPLKYPGNMGVHGIQ